jgi:chemotaxis signal transduction protein
MSAAEDMSARREQWAQALLRERAAQLARAQAPDAAPVITRLVCAAAGHLYGLPLTRLARVLSYQRPASAPSANPAMMGAIGRGGGFYLIYDLARIIDPARKSEAGGHIILLRRALPRAGLRVDEALGVVGLAPLEERELSGVAPQHSSISGFARHPDGRLVSLIDLNKMLPPLSRAAGEGGA